MLPVSGPIPECSTQESFAAASFIVPALYHWQMAEREVDEVELDSLVSGALNVGPVGLSAKNNATTDYGRHEAVKINQVLYSKGYSASEATAWWNTRSQSLDSATPLQVFRSEESPSPGTIQAVRNAVDSERSKSRS